jgi:sterol desaturase/sphingolipid hydroxylase (fatty acid hydroxylase superfamily)
MDVPRPGPLTAAPRHRARDSAEALGAIAAIGTLAYARAPATVLTFATYFTVFFIFERLVPAAPQAVFRRGWATDLAYFGLISSGLLIGPVAFFALAHSVISVGHSPLTSLTTAQPGWLQFIEAFLIVEVGFYWAHRGLHSRWLWRFHRIHHSSEDLDWLSFSRFHPVDQAVLTLSYLVPLYLLGFPLRVFAAYLGITAVESALLHSNVRLGLGVVEFVVATPHFHRWHHAVGETAASVNFAGQLALLDVVWGTFCVPADWPLSCGVKEPVPTGFIGQVFGPLLGVLAIGRRRPRPETGSTAATPATWGASAATPSAPPRQMLRLDRRSSRDMGVGPE